MRSPKDAAAKKPPRRLDEDLDRSRKQKLWLRSNYVASIVIVALFGMSILNMVSDVRGEYAGNVASMQNRMAICSIVHVDKQLNMTLILPNTPLLQCTTSEENIGQDVDWTFALVHPQKGLNPVHFKGKIDPNSMTGVIQDGQQIIPISLSKDLMASIARQLRAFIPNAN